MNILKTAALCIALLPALGACTTTTRAPEITDEAALQEYNLQKELALKEIIDGVQRIEDVSFPILHKNAELCEDMTKPSFSIATMTVKTAPSFYKSVYEDVYHVGDWPTVVVIAKGSSAAKQLRPGDMITHVNGKALKKGKSGISKLYETIENLEPNEKVQLAVTHLGESRIISVAPDIVCSSQVFLEQSPMINASADGKNIQITTSILRFTENDEELALVIGHELAHNTHSHVASKRARVVVGTILGAVTSVAIGVDVTNIGAHIGANMNSQSFESEADYVGLYYAARAGYDVSKAPNLWRRMGINNPRSIHLEGTTHPSSVKRLLALEAAAKEIEEKRQKGLPLVPEIRENDAEDEEDSAYNQ